jgi:hypothetical protein
MSAINPVIPGMVLDKLARPLGGEKAVTNITETAENSALISEPHLVLLANARLDVLVMTPTTVRSKGKRRYFRTPKTFSYAAVAAQLEIEAPILTRHVFVSRPETNLTDEELDKRYRRKGQSESVALQTLKLRWSLVEPLVTGTDGELLFDPSHRAVLLNTRAREILADIDLRDKVIGQSRKRQVKRGKNHRHTLEGQIMRLAKEIQRLINQFWAGGSVRGALIGFAAACGGKGKPKRAGAAKRGRPNAKQLEGKSDEQGLNIAEGSELAKIIKFCYDTWVVRDTTVSYALRQMWDEFFSSAEQQSDGTTKKVWLPVWQRPTRIQFDYWGKREDRGAAAWRKQLPPSKFDKSYRAIMGSVSDDVYGIGQRGGIDSTPPDIQFVRAIDRLARIGGGHRIIIVEALFGYIPGLYMGFDPPSSSTVRLALYSSLDPDKRQWLDDLSLEDIPAEDFIPIWFSNLWADNTDLRTEEIKRCATGINTNIHFIPKLRSDLNSLAEGGHHTLHKMVDHKMHGSSYGRQNQRGEVPPTYRARHTMMEAIRETVRAIHVHNTAEVEDNRPLRMRLKNVAPTRVAMTREMIRIGHVARTLHAVDLARRHLLPRRMGTFTPKGVCLHREDADKSEFLNHVIYVSKHPIIARWCEEARKGGKHDSQYFRASFIVDPTRPRRIWHVDPSTGQEIELEIKVLVVRDSELPFQMTMPDMIDRDRLEASERIDRRDARERAIGAMEVKQRATLIEAEAAYQEATEQSGGEPPKSVMKNNKRENREKELKDTFYGVPLPDAVRPQGSTSIAADQAEADADVTKVSTKSDPAGTVDPACNSHAAQPVPAAHVQTPRRKNALLHAAIKKLAEGHGNL